MVLPFFIGGFTEERERRGFRKEMRKRMNTKLNSMGKMNLFGSMMLVIVLALSSCAPAPVPVVKAEPPAPQCSVRLGDVGSITVSGAYTKLGVDWYDKKTDPDLLVNGEVKHKSDLNQFQQGDYFELAIKPANCVGNYTGARRVNFKTYATDPNSKTMFWREVSGFKGLITYQRWQDPLVQVCGEGRWYLYGLGFNQDLDKGGCDFPIFIKTSWSDGSITCERHERFFDAYNAYKDRLDTIMWVTVFSVGQAPEQDFCK